MDVTCSATDTAEGLRVVVEGEIDLVTAPAVRRYLFDVLDAQPPGGRILLDLAGVAFFAAAGVRALEDAHTRAGARHVELALAATSPAVALVLRIVKSPAVHTRDP
jgi:anti-sigma B factor antagonist